MESKRCISCDKKFFPSSKLMNIFGDLGPREGWKCGDCLRHKKERKIEFA